MKKENLHILQRIQPALEKIIANECDSIYEEYNSNKSLLLKVQSDLKRLQKEKEDVERSKSNREDLAGKLRQVVDLLVSDGVLEIIQDGDSRYDEYGNGGGYHAEYVKYKDKQIELQHGSF